ncbi:DEAD/DEAH box helicase family protein [Inquilinus sp. NPDC058860]|uniref:DEAD/DEAH box helicase family protein n=1 Tax=Inquilinus sp. NPDC058860 TaxID=3346652 RepID=UPI003678B117
MTPTPNHTKPGFVGDLAASEFLTEYRSLKDNPIGSFYRRCLRESILYRRAVGYFRSSVFLVIGSSIVEFARRGGTIRLICSPELDPDDIDSIALGYARRSERIAETIVDQFDSLLADPRTAQPARVLATLIATGTLEVKLAMRADRKGLYHEKIGIFGDGYGNCVSFKGSANETWSGWDGDGNFESIEVFCSWRGGLEAERVRRHEVHFESLWSEEDPDVEVFPFPTSAVAHLKKAAFARLDHVEIEQLPLPKRRSALPHQSAAIQAWAGQGYRGIFQHATGSGKTYTAILAIREHAARGLPTLILVPSRLLLEQWAEEVRDELPNAALLLAGGGHDRWRRPRRLRGMTDRDPSLGSRVVLATMQTASMAEFISNVVSGDHLLVVADEVHQIGSPQNSSVLTIEAGRRLGLSATPKRYGDPDGTARIMEYFGTVVPPPITLIDAIRSGRLVPYEYYPHPISLTADEAAQWTDISITIKREIAKQNPDKFGNRALSEKAKLLLIKRARIAKKAHAKLRLAIDILRTCFEGGQSWLVYCEDAAQLDEVRDGLRSIGLDPVEYHSGMDGSRDATMSWFRSFGGVLVSIRCLDEGVDIPAVSHALILASSQNPRQFIQRRGRVLRRSGGKQIAVIHDAIVVPTSEADDSDQLGLLRGELVRSVEFASNAINRDAAAELRGIAIRMGMDPGSIPDEGMEDE